MLVVVVALVVALFLVAPILIVVPMSFSTAISFQFPPPGYWLGYYVRYFTGTEWLEPTLNSVVIALGATGLTMALVVPASFGYVRFRFRGKSFVNLLIMAPLVVPHVVSALAYYGFLARLRLNGTHLGVIVAHGVLAVPLAFLVITATLKGFDRNLERAAMSSGAGPLATFFHVTLPVLRPGMLVGALFAFLSSFNEAVVALFIAGRGAATLPKKMYESIRLESDPVIAVVSTLLVTTVAIGVLVSVLARGRESGAA
ncbi:MAG: ABC transporter permease [Candidatus Rokuibacteriota bacterium]|nr:MAG: ABC transporter permease [Candidatus Rokubacteria bacterium]